MTVWNQVYVCVYVCVYSCILLYGCVFELSYQLFTEVFSAMLESVSDTDDFYPFPTKSHALLYMLRNSSRPMVCFSACVFISSLYIKNH